MSPWQGLNRRRFPRIKYPCLVTVWSGEEESRQTFLTHTENVGIGGVCITCSQRFKLFSSVSLEIDLMDMEEHIVCVGKVVWVVQHKDPDKQKPLSFDVGVEFRDLKEENQRRISKIVQRLGKYTDNMVD